MVLLHGLLVLIVFAGPIAMIAYVLRSKLGLFDPTDENRARGRPDDLRAPPLWTILVWIGALVVLIALEY